MTQNNSPQMGLAWMAASFILSLLKKKDIGPAVSKFYEEVLSVRAHLLPTRKKAALRRHFGVYFVNRILSWQCGRLQASHVCCAQQGQCRQNSLACRVSDDSPNSLFAGWGTFPMKFKMLLPKEVDRLLFECGTMVGLTLVKKTFCAHTSKPWALFGWIKTLKMSLKLRWRL